jgi:hypothetical protein
MTEKDLPLIIVDEASSEAVRPQPTGNDAVQEAADMAPFGLGQVIPIARHELGNRLSPHGPDKYFTASASPITKRNLTAKEIALNIFKSIKEKLEKPN